MASPETKAWDGHSVLKGVDRFTDVAILPDAFVSNAVNRTFRRQRCGTRPGFVEYDVQFDGDDALENEEVFKRGNIHGCFGYEKTLKKTAPHVICAVADRILKGSVFGDTILFSTLYKGINPYQLHSWFEQGIDKLFWQNSREEPIVWNGVDSSRKIVGGIANDVMPIGNIMAFIHGRIVVFDSDNYALASDFIYGSGLTPNSPGLESFIEIQYFDDIGAIATPANLGQVTGAKPVAKIPNRNAQGELIVGCEHGFYSLNLSGPRGGSFGGTDFGWLYGDIQHIVLTGRGNASPYSMVQINNDIWFRDSDGSISTYRFERSEQEKEWGDTSLSTEVQDYLKYDDKELLRFCSAAFINNRLYFTTGLSTEGPDIAGYGANRFGQGMVVLDFDRGSNVNRKGPFQWEGLWTGINPIQIITLNVNNAERNMFFSYDDDNVNRIYEIREDETNDRLAGNRCSIVSFYDTGNLFEQNEVNQEVIIKELQGVNMEFSGVDENAEIEVEYRPNKYGEWIPLGRTTVGCFSEECLSDMLTNEEGCQYSEGELVPFYDIETIGAEDAQSTEQASDRLTKTARRFQFRIKVTGFATVEMFQAWVGLRMADFFQECKDESEKACEGIRYCEPSPFSYSISGKANG